MFNFVVKYLGALKIVPLFPNIFDGLLTFYTYLTNPRLLDGMDDITSGVLSWPGTTKSLHKYGGLQFNCAGREMGHLHGNGILDVRLSRKLKAQLMQEGRVKDHHVFKATGWISFYMDGWDDAEYAIHILRLSWQQINQTPLK
jgi:predicted DNA-binding protein (MmcQ/YjbR family)